jgi:hypothetical protein
MHLHGLPLTSSTSRRDIAGLAATLLEASSRSILVETSTLAAGATATTTGGRTPTPTTSGSEATAGRSSIRATVGSWLGSTLFDVDRFGTDLVGIGSNCSSVAMWCLKLNKGAILL